MEVPSHQERDDRNRPASQRFVTRTWWSISARPGSSKGKLDRRAPGKSGIAGCQEASRRGIATAVPLLYTWSWVLPPQPPQPGDPDAGTFSFTSGGVHRHAC